MSGKKVKIDNYITGTKLKGFRQQKGLSLAKAAHEIGVTPAFISMVENGKCGISFEKVHSLVKLYGKTLEDIGRHYPSLPLWGGKSDQSECSFGNLL